MYIDDRVLDYEDKLIKGARERMRLLQQDRDRKKPKPNELMAQDETEGGKGMEWFWCGTCLQDFYISKIYKTEHRLFGEIIVMWRALCPWCGRALHRHLTHRDDDPYYERSKRVRIMRNEFKTDTLQADEWGFKSNYGAPYREHQEAIKKKRDNILNKDDGLRGLSLEDKEKLSKLKYA